MMRRLNLVTSLNLWRKRKKFASMITSKEITTIDFTFDELDAMRLMIQFKDDCQRVANTLDVDLDVLSFKIGELMIDKSKDEEVEVF